MGAADFLKPQFLSFSVWWRLSSKEKEREGLLPMGGLNILKADHRSGASPPRRRLEKYSAIPDIRTQPLEPETLAQGSGF